MEELRNMLEQIILFYEKYDETATPFGNKALKEFWSTEEMSAGFVMGETNYYICQTWRRNLFNCTHSITIYKNGAETNHGIFFVRTLLADLEKSMH